MDHENVLQNKIEEFRTRLLDERDCTRAALLREFLCEAKLDLIEHRKMVEIDQRKFKILENEEKKQETKMKQETKEFYYRSLLIQESDETKKNEIREIIKSLKNNPNQNDEQKI